jgi:hypothetical protein
MFTLSYADGNERILAHLGVYVRAELSVNTRALSHMHGYGYGVKLRSDSAKMDVVVTSSYTSTQQSSHGRAAFTQHSSSETDRRIVRHPILLAK